MSGDQISQWHADRPLQMFGAPTRCRLPPQLPVRCRSARWLAAACERDLR